jgi:hypothetical protein
MPGVSVRLGTRKEDVELYRNFTAWHPRFILIRKKTIGVALLPLRSFSGSNDYLRHVNGKNSAAYFARKATREGYVFQRLDPDKFSEQIHAIHLSSKERQGIELTDTYRKKLEKYPNDGRNSYYGIFKDDALVAYLWVVHSGELLLLNRIMGHSDHLRHGIMYLLVTAFICSELANTDATCKVVMYDTILGASSGLRMFKERCGFKPFRAKWIIEER